MEATEILEIVNRGEDSKNQFKVNVTNSSSLAGEMVAFSNSGGGCIFIGVSDDGNIQGLTNLDVGRLNQLISNTASQSVRPPINPETENVSFPEGLVIVIKVSDGISKPYMDNAGAVWVKNGSDKRKVTSIEELQRMYQSAGLVYGDAIPATGMTVADLDLEYFKDFFWNQYQEEFETQDLPLPGILQNMNLMRDEILNITGALLFAKSPQIRLPVFMVKAVSYP
ncbi:MAG: ATP-binding protein [Desulfobulbaceae bacterium]|nr:ATP-binding protein [Desulfobulbaceae bacterium]